MRIDSSINPAIVARLYGVTGPAAPTAPLAAAKVDQPIEFEGPRPSGSTESLQLYTRAADTVEAATGVSIGRSVDIRG